MGAKDLAVSILAEHRKGKGEDKEEKADPCKGAAGNILAAIKSGDEDALASSLRDFSEISRDKE